ncbi:hypothetical protein, partial [Actinobacillus pleuropneumoniae]|uniref:hypothetical protein n=1 Tax=Actinobacillus pleuropneumoniae TaxID=715 RepID=UPI00227A686B
GGGNCECLIKPQLEMFFNHFFLLLGSVNLYLQSLGFPHLGQALRNSNRLRGSSNIIIGLL